jgi:tetratricopeptide (TPR) repeat protein
VALEPGDAAVYSGRAALYRALGKSNEAVADLRKAVSLEPSSNVIREELRLAEQQLASNDAVAKSAAGKEVEQAKTELRKAQEAAKAAELRLAALEGKGHAPAMAKGTETDLTEQEPEKLARSLQSELKRVGCDPGAVDGKWGKRAQSALQKFALQTKSNLASGEPTPAALEAVSAHKARVCPLQCDDDEMEVKGKCVAKPSKAKTVRSAEPRERRQQAAPRRARSEESASERSAPAPGVGGSISIGIGRGVGVGIGF